MLKFTWHCCWHRKFHLSTLIFHDILNSSPSGSMNQMPRNSPAFVKPRFSVRPSDGFSSKAVNLVKPVHASDNSFFIHVPIIFNIFSNNTSASFVTLHLRNQKMQCFLRTRRTACAIGSGTSLIFENLVNFVSQSL